MCVLVLSMNVALILHLRTRRSPTFSYSFLLPQVSKLTYTHFKHYEPKTTCYIQPIPQNMDNDQKKEAMENCGQIQGFSITKVLSEVESPVWRWVDSSQGIESRECDRMLCNGCRTGDLEMVKKALDDGANPRVQFRLALGEITPIFLCASKGYWEIAIYLIEKNKEIIHDTMGFDGTTCLHHAAFNDHPQMCDLLINKGCHVNRRYINAFPL